MKTVIVTGGNGNLGQAVKNKFLSNGYEVISTLRSKNSLLTSNDKNPDQVVVDLTDAAATRIFVDSIIEKHDSIDIAVLTVGGFAMGKIEDTETSAVSDQYKLNFETAYNVARPVFLQMMKQGYGRIFFIGSRPGFDAKQSKNKIAYGLSKSLLFRLSELMNIEAAGNDVFTSVVVPSIIDTPQNREAMPDADFSEWVSPDAIADIIYFHSSPVAEPVRQSVIHINDTV